MTETEESPICREYVVRKTVPAWFHLQEVALQSDLDCIKMLSFRTPAASEQRLLE